MAPPRIFAIALVLFFLSLSVGILAGSNEVTPFNRTPMFIVPRLDGTVSAFEALSGKHIWNFSTGGPLMQSSSGVSVSPMEVSIFNTIQQEGLRDLYPDSHAILGASPFMSPDGTIFLTHKSSKLYSLDPKTGEIVASNIFTSGTPSEEASILTEDLMCRSLLHIVRTEHILETHNGSSTHFLTVSNVRAFLRECQHDDHFHSSNVDTTRLPLLTATPMGDLQAYDDKGNLLWLFDLPASPSNLVYVLKANSITPIRPQPPPKLPGKVVPLSLSHYKGTPFEFGLPEPSKTLALPPPPISSDHGRRSVWYWIAAISMFTAATIWGIIILKYQKWKISTPPQPIQQHISEPQHTTPSTVTYIPRSESTQRLRAEHEELQKQFHELKQLQEQMQQERSRSRSHSPVPSSSAEPSNALSRYTTDFEEKERLGEGGFGTVFRAINKLDGVEYAIKKVCLSQTSKKEHERVLREVRHLALLDHGNIIRYYQSWIEEGEWNGSRRNSISDSGYDESFDGDSLRSIQSDAADDNSEANYEGDESKLGNSVRSDTSVYFSNSKGDFEPVQLDFTKPDLSFCGVADLDSVDITFGHGDTDKDKSNSLVKRHDGLDITEERLYGSTSTSISHMQRSSDSSTQCRKTILYIQMQYCHQGTLQHWLTRPDRVVCPQEAVAIFRQIVRGVQHIHANLVIHRDLKPPNILISADGVVKIGDFGLSTGAVEGGAKSPMRILTRSHTTGVGSPLYCSPEQLSGERYDSKVDIYSLGIILYEMFHIFSTQMERVTHITQLRTGKINDETQELYPKLVELTLQLVQTNPANRPKASEILSHPFIAATSS